MLILCIPAFQLDNQSPPQNLPRKSHRNHHSAQLANTTLVAKADGNGNSTSTASSEEKINYLPTLSTGCSSPIVSKTSKTCMPLIRRILQDNGLSSTARTIIENSWRSSSRSQYKVYLEKWIRYCSSRNIDQFSPSVGEAINFLAMLFDTGLGYSAINNARCALSSVIVLPGNTAIGKHPLVCRLLKGVYELRSSLPRYQEIWNMDLVIQYLSSLHPNEELSLKFLTLKLAMLLALLSGQRRQTLHCLDINSMQLDGNKCVFVINKLLKSSKPGKHLGKLEFQAYTPDVSVCGCLLNEYIKMTAPLRGQVSQFISFVKSYRPISPDMVSSTTH